MEKQKKQDNGATKKAKISTMKIVLCGLFAALCCVSTMIIKIPSPTQGYAHIGDGMVIISGIVLGPVFGGLAAGIGSMLADVFSGYFIYAPATFVIKFLCALFSGICYHKLVKKGAKALKKLMAALLGGLASEVTMVVLYLAFECVLYGVGGAVPGILSNVGQGLVGIVIALLLVIPLSNISAKLKQE